MSYWNKINRRRGELIDKKIKGSITDGEQTELECLQAYADCYLNIVAPVQTNELEKLEDMIVNKFRQEGQ